MGIWPFGREKADVDTASRVVVLRARDAVPMRAKVTLKFVAPQTQTVADQTAEISSDLLRGVVREAPTALSVLGYEAVMSAEVIARLPHEAAALRSMEIAGLHIVGDPGHMARPAAPNDVPDWLTPVPQPSSSASSEAHTADRAMDRPTPIQPIPGREVGMPARGSVINPTPAHPMPVVKRIASVTDRVTPTTPMPASKPATPQAPPPSSTQHAPPPSTRQAPPSAQQAPPSTQQAPSSTQQAPPSTQQAPPPAAPREPSPATPQTPPSAIAAIERTVRSPMNALPGAPGATSGDRSSELPSAPSPGGTPEALAPNALSPTQPLAAAPAAPAAPAAHGRAAVLPPAPERSGSSPPETTPPPPSSSLESSRQPLSASYHRTSSSASFTAVRRGDDGPRSAGQRPSGTELLNGPPSSISGGRYTSRPPPAAVAARRRVIASRLALPAGAGPYEVARGLTPLFRDTAGRILVAFLRAYDLTVVRRVPFDAVEGDILSSLTAPSDGAPGTYNATHASEISRWREALGAAKMEQLQREANLAAAAIGHELLSAEGVPPKMTNAVVEGLAGSAFGEPDLLLDLGRYLFPVNGTTSAEVMASMIAIAREDAPPGLETALEPLFAALREDVAAAMLIAKEVMGVQ